MEPFPEHSDLKDCGLLVVGHGSREAVGVREFLATVDQMRSLAEPTPIEPCFLEFAEPSIAEGFRRLVERGVHEVIVTPVLLFAAGHAKRDIPEAVAAAASRVPGIMVRQAEHLGAEPGLLALSEKRCDEALAGAAKSFGQSLLVLVGRGSLDAEATAEMHAFAEARARIFQSGGKPSPSVEVAFVAMCEPRLSEVLERAAAGPPQRIVVQPHLLFGGVLLDRIADTVREFAIRHPQHEWLMADYLGPHPLVAEALLARAAATCRRDNQSP